MQKSRIEWTDYTINPIKGLCPVDCKDNQGKSYCYARRIYKRFHWDGTIREDVNVYQELAKMKAGSKVFVGSTIELFGGWVTPLMRSNMFHVIEMYPDLTFIFLTKQPQNLPRVFDDNCWVGVSSTGDFDMTSNALGYLWGIKAKVKFISFEPLLKENEVDMLTKNISKSGINWVLIGQQTPVSIKTQPKIEWIKEIVDACDEAGIPVFLKDNLIHLMLTPSQDSEYGRYFKKGNLPSGITGTRGGIAIA